MKRKNLLFQAVMILGLFGFFGAQAFGQITLKHSYNFEDGTADDAVGGVNGVLQGSAQIVDGVLDLTGNGFVSLSGEQIDIGSYESVTVEAFFSQGEAIDGFRTLFAFGRTNMDPGWPMGVDYFHFQPTREDDESRVAISTLNYDNPWTSETYVGDQMFTDTRVHHVICILTQTDITMYLDGEFRGTEALTGDNALSSVSADTVFFGKTVYLNDPTWEGFIEEIHIYEGAMDETTVADRFLEVMGDAYFDPSLAELSVNRGEMIPAFEPMTTDYELFVPYGTPSIDLNAVPTVGGADVAIFDAQGNDYSEDGIVVIPDQGIDLEIIVTALDGTSQATYYLSVFHNPANESSTLSDIQLSQGYFTSAFNFDSLEYTAIVPHGVGSVDVTGVPSWENATVEGDGSIAISEGTGLASIKVTSENGENSQTYTVNLLESEFTTGKDLFIQHESSGLVVGENNEDDDLIRLYYPLNNMPDQYFQFEQSGEVGQYLVRNQQGLYMKLDPTSDWNIQMVEELPNDLDSARFVFDEFEPDRFRIMSVAKDNLETGDKFMGPNNNNALGGVFSDKPIGYDLNVWSIKDPVDLVGPYDTFLDTLAVDAAKLVPGFTSGLTEYMVVVPKGISALNIDATPRDMTSTISGTGEIQLDERGTITITVTAEDPDYTRDYVINYVRDTELTMMHSYSFVDGTARDMVGTANGDVNGGVIENGSFIASEEGDFITLPAEEIAINEYPSITLEAFVVNGDNTTYTMLAYFGGMNGAGSYWIQPTRGDNSSRTEVITGSGATASGPQSAVDMPYHFVSVLTNDSISWYIDGELMASTAMEENNFIGGISLENAWIGRGGWSDPSWLGTVLEFNIYSGVMDPATVAERSGTFPVEDETTNAALRAITYTDEALIAGFNSSTFEYEVVLEQGTTEVPELIGVTANPEASVVVTQATELSESTTFVVTSEDGSYENTYTVNFMVDEPVGIIEAQKDSKPEVVVYPTVTSGSFIVEAEGELGVVTVYNLAGQVVSQENIQSSTTEINVPRAGIYIIRVQSGNADSVIKVIKTN